MKSQQKRKKFRWQFSKYDFVLKNLKILKNIEIIDFREGQHYRRKNCQFWGHGSDHRIEAWMKPKSKKTSTIKQFVELIFGLLPAFRLGLCGFRRLVSVPMESRRRRLLVRKAKNKNVIVWSDKLLSRPRPSRSQFFTTISRPWKADFHHWLSRNFGRHKWMKKTKSYGAQLWVWLGCDYTYEVEIGFFIKVFFHRNTLKNLEIERSFWNRWEYGCRSRVNPTKDHLYSAKLPKLKRSKRSNFTLLRIVSYDVIGAQC